MMNPALKYSFAALCGAIAILPLDVSATRASLVDEVCTHNTYMCCWTENDNGVQDNTDVCSLTTFHGREVEYPGNEEGKVHCHGFVWADGASYESFILPLYKFVRTFDHRDARGYYGRLKGAPQCECLEKMPVVTRADCTTYSAQGLVACKNNDLRTHYDGVMKRPGGKIDFNLVGNCNKNRGGDKNKGDKKKGDKKKGDKTKGDKGNGGKGDGDMSNDDKGNGGMGNGDKNDGDMDNDNMGDRSSDSGEGGGNMGNDGGDSGEGGSPEGGEGGDGYDENGDKTKGDDGKSDNDKDTDDGKGGKGEESDSEGGEGGKGDDHYMDGPVSTQSDDSTDSGSRGNRRGGKGRGKRRHRGGGSASDSESK